MVQLWRKISLTQWKLVLQLECALASVYIPFDGESQEVTRTLSSADIRYGGWVADIWEVGFAFESQPRLAAHDSSS